VHAVCTRTGNLAQYSFRKAQNQDIVMLGETEEYEPLSRGAYYKAILESKIQKIEVKDPQEITPDINQSTSEDVS